MTILSFSFFLFVLALLLIYYIVPQRFRWTILLLGSVIFYFLSSKVLIIFPITETIIIFVIGLLLDKKNEVLKELKTSDLAEEEKKEIKENTKLLKKRYVLLGVILSVLAIIITKYASFCLENLNALLDLFHFKSGFSIENILIPLGISYYTLEAIGYVVDVYRGVMPAEKNVFKLTLFLLYFPKVVEGPISKFKDLKEQFFEKNALDFSKITIGLDLIIYGLFKKMIIADRAGIFVNEVFTNSLGGITTFVAMVLYTVEIYAEFSGCIDIVRGVSHLFGVELPINFKRPFFSQSIQEFWQRWHMSLGAWIKEYVFFPVSLSKMNSKVVALSKEKMNAYWSKFITVAFPLFFVWIVNGIWHGASYKYVVYGMYYYVFMMLALLAKPLFDRILKKIAIGKNALALLRIIRTCLFVVVGMTLFRTPTLGEFGKTIISLFRGDTGILNHGLVMIDFVILILGNIFVFLISILEEKKKLSLEKGFTEKPFIRAIVYTFIISSIIIFGIYGDGYDSSQFIYGAF